MELNVILIVLALLLVGAIIGLIVVTQQKNQVKTQLVEASTKLDIETKQREQEREEWNRQRERAEEQRNEERQRAKEELEKQISSMKADAERQKAESVEALKTSYEARIVAQEKH